MDAGVVVLLVEVATVTVMLVSQLLLFRVAYRVAYHVAYSNSEK